MTLIAFLPVLLRLSANITEIPIVRRHPLSAGRRRHLVVDLRNGFLALIGIRLPGLEFKNQRVEAAYRKELVYGEDDAEPGPSADRRANFSSAVRTNYFRLYFNYMYFNIGRIFYLQTDNIFPYIILAPTIVAGKITLGAMNQILNAFGQVRNSFQYLVKSWTTIVELLSVYKRLRAFEATLHGEPLPALDQDFLAGKTPA